jgi:tRNA nucleotidyltransferase (CCA-adding enzyme)
VTGSRIGAELRLALLEPDPLAPLADLTEKLPITVDRALVQAALALAPPDASRTLLILAAVTRERAPATWIESLELLARERDVVLQAKRAPELAAAIEAAKSPSELGAILRGVPVEVIAIAGALGSAAATRRWLTELRHIALEIDGDDLLAAGIVAGPELGARLERTLARKLDGQIDDGRQAELESALGERP